MDNKTLTYIKKEVSELIKNLRDYFVIYKKLLIIRVLEYVLILFLVTFLCYVIFEYYNFFYPCIDRTSEVIINETARRSLSGNVTSVLTTLIESEAAIIAIVISLTLVAVELTASTYSPRVINISLKNPDIWILLIIYGSAMGYSLMLLKLEPLESSFIPSEDVSVALWLGMYSYIVLVPYLWHICDLLKPETIIKRLAMEISKDKLLQLSEEVDTSMDAKTSTVDDPVQPIIDIIRKAVINYEFVTIRSGLNELTSRMIEVIDSNKWDKNEVNKILKHFSERLKRIGKLAASEKDEEQTIEVINSLKRLGDYTLKFKFIDASKNVIEVLGTVGVVAANNEFQIAAWKVVKNLESIGIVVIEQIRDISFVSETVDEIKSIINDVLGAAKEHKLKEVEETANQSINNLADKMQK